MEVLVRGTGAECALLVVGPFDGTFHLQGASRHIHGQHTLTHLADGARQGLDDAVACDRANNLKNIFEGAAEA